MYNSNKHTGMAKEESDMISHLPDEMLQHVLSFLGTKEAVQTGLLSKRWVNLWASLPCLSFNPHDELRKGVLCEIFIPKFKRFVETVLYRREASFLDTFLIKFPLILDEDTCSDLVHTCVSYAMKHNARVFSIEGLIPFEELIACLFSCESIEKMCLRASFWPHRDTPEVIPKAVNLPRIRRLHLQNSKLDSRNISRLLLGCPRLEELSLENCFGDFSSIFSQQLKYLSLHGCVLKHRPDDKILSITSGLHGDYIKSKITIYSSLVQFILKTPGASALNNPLSFMQNYIHRLGEDDHLRGLSGVTMLKLHRQNFKMLEKELQKLEEFHCLMELWLSGWCMICNFSPVALFLQKSSNLQKLTLYNCGQHCRGEKTGIHQIVDNSLLLELFQCKNLTVVHIKLSKYHIRAHKVEEALLPHRKEFEKNHLEIVLSHIDIPFWF